jgi:hypothetical protein
MLGVNLLFAGFVLTLNGFSYIKPVDERAKGMANAFVGIIIAINAVFQTAQATSFTAFGFSAAMWLFSLNYLIIAAHIFLKCENWKVFGLYGLFASIVSFVFAGEAFILNAPWELRYMWCMWGVLWAQTFLSILMEIKSVDKFTPHILILNGITSTFIPGFLILLGIIL